MRILISGQMRSGTTFLANLLNQQPRMVVLADFLHIGRLLEEEGVGSLTLPLGEDLKRRVIDRFTGVSAGDGLRAIVDATGAEFSFDLDPARFDDLRGFYIDVLDQLRGAENTLVGHKTTCAEPVFEHLLRAVDDLKIVNMVRDPRDVLLSNRRMMKQEPGTILRNWSEGMETLQRLRRDPSLRSRLFVLRHEDLMQRPGGSLRRLAEFLETGPLESPAELTWYGRPFVANSSFDDIRRPFDTRGIGRWKEAGLEIPLLACLLAGPQMHRLGYKTSWPIRARAALIRGAASRATLHGIADWLELPSSGELEKACAA